MPEVTHGKMPLARDIHCCRSFLFLFPDQRLFTVKNVCVFTYFWLRRGCIWITVATKQYCECLVCVCVCVCVVILCVFVVLCVHCCFFFPLGAGLLAISQYSEGPATGHLDTGFSWFPRVYKQMLRWFPRFQVATTCFSCSPPDLNSVVTNFMFCVHVK